MYGLVVGPTFVLPNAHASSSTKSLPSTSSLISSKLNLGLGVLYTVEVERKATVFSDAFFVCVPIPKRRGGGGFTPTDFGLEEPGSGNTFLRKSAIAFSRVLRLILASPNYLRNITLSS